MPGPNTPTSIMLRSGQYFDLATPETAEFNIQDIASALSKLCRFTGHCDPFYSVAQHSVLVSCLVPREHALAALLHDAAEAFVGDVAAPLKQMLPDYKRIERRVESALLKYFGVEGLPACVKDADLRMLRTEQRDVMSANDHVWEVTGGIEPAPFKIVPLIPQAARGLFLSRFWEITEK